MRKSIVGLTEEDILDMFKSNDVKTTELAAKYGISESLISTIRSGRAWSSVTGKKYEKKITKPRIKISDEDVIAVYHCTDPRPEIAKRYGIAISAVGSIKDGSTRADVTGSTREPKPKTRLRPSEVLEIYWSQEPSTALAERFNISTTNVGHIRNGRTWLKLTPGQ